MSYRTTLVLAVILVALGLLVYFFPKKRPTGDTGFGPEVWSVPEEEIDRIEIRLHPGGLRAAFVKGEDESWYFDEAPKAPVDKKRWGGIVLLVSGPSSKRLIAQKAEDPSVYGFGKPRMEILLAVRGRGTLKVLVGDSTPNEANRYVKLQGYDAIYTVDHSWFDVMERLVREPPRPKPD